MEYLIKDDMLFLQDYEEKLSHLEEELLEGNMEDFDRKILLSRKELSVLSAYYEQLSDMGETLQQNAARHQTEQEALLLGFSVRRQDDCMTWCRHSKSIPCSLEKCIRRRSISGRMKL